MHNASELQCHTEESRLVKLLQKEMRNYNPGQKWLKQSSVSPSTHFINNTAIYTPPNPIYIWKKIKQTERALLMNLN